MLSKIKALLRISPPKAPEPVRRGSRPTCVGQSAGPGCTVYTSMSQHVALPAWLGNNKYDYFAAIEALLAETFGEAFKERLDGRLDAMSTWLVHTKREPRDLIELLSKETVHVEVKALALVILLTPAFAYLPGRLRPARKNDDFLNSDLHVEVLSTPLQTLAARLVVLNADFVLKAEYNEKLYTALYTYNMHVLKLLALRDESDPLAAQLFARYQLNDPTGFWNLESASGYNPFVAMLRSDVPEKWKRLLDGQMRLRVTREASGLIKPDYEWEGAPATYVDHLGSMLYGQLPYSLELFASQVNFASEQQGTVGSGIFVSYQLSRLFSVLAGDGYKELRHKIARRAVLEADEKHRFSVYSNEMREIAEVMRNEFSSEDHELAEALSALIIKGVEEMALSEANAANARAAEQAAAAKVERQLA